MAKAKKKPAGLGKTWLMGQNRLGETLDMGSYPDTGWCWVRYGAGQVRTNKPWYGMTEAERKRVRGLQRRCVYRFTDPEAAGLIRAAVETGDLAPLRALADRLADGESPGWDPRAVVGAGLKDRRGWKRALELLGGVRPDGRPLDPEDRLVIRSKR